MWAEKIEITALKMQATQLSKKIHFIGNAKVKQQKSWIVADEITVTFDENNQTKSYEAYGHVWFEMKYQKQHYKGSANKVVFTPADQSYLLEGNALIDDVLENRHITADKIVLDTKTGRIKILGNRKKPVKFIFETEQKK